MDNLIKELDLQAQKTHFWRLLGLGCWYILRWNAL